jgi:hypothetical protein
MPCSAAALEGPRDAGLGVSHLVHDGAGDAHAVPLEQRRVEHDLVDRAADAALADDDGGRPEEARDDRVREPDDGTDAGVPGALDEHDVAVAGELTMGGHDPQILDHPTDVRK